MSAFMEYVPTPHPAVAAQMGHGADKYQDAAVAAEYRKKRESEPKWFLEQAIIEDMLDDLNPGDWVLDVPCGTGRFFKFYDKKGLVFCGVDKSVAMLMEAAAEYIGSPPPEDQRQALLQGFTAGNTVRLGDKCILRQADVRFMHDTVTDEGLARGLSLAPKSVDAAVMCRLTRWLTPDECKLALQNLQWVTRKQIIFTARVANHQHARTLELFESVLDGWKVHRNGVGVDMDYRILELRPC